MQRESRPGSWLVLEDSDELGLSKTKSSNRYVDALLDGDILGAIAIDIIVYARAAISRIGQRNAARIQREIHAAGALQIQPIVRGARVAANDKVDGVAIHAFTRGAAEIDHVGRIQRHGI